MIYANGDPSEWDRLAALLLLDHCSAVHEASRETPAKLMFGREIRYLSTSVQGCGVVVALPRLRLRLRPLFFIIVTCPVGSDSDSHYKSCIVTTTPGDSDSDSATLPLWYNSRSAPFRYGAWVCVASGRNHEQGSRIQKKRQEHDTMECKKKRWISHEKMPVFEEKKPSNPHPFGLGLITHSGGGGVSVPPVISQNTDRFSKFKRHSIALYVNFPNMV